jgi:hypothetical protein
LSININIENIENNGVDVAEVKVPVLLEDRFQEACRAIH